MQPIGYGDLATPEKAILSAVTLPGVRSNPLVTEERPWGSWTVLEEGHWYKIKRLEVLPGQRLSLQMHYHRSEHWVVVAGTARVRVGEQEIFVHPNQSTFVPPATVHRVENPGSVLLVIIEIQTGEYLQEDDIVRSQDDYGRVPGGNGDAARPATEVYVERKAYGGSRLVRTRLEPEDSPAAVADGGPSRGAADRPVPIP